VGVVGVVAGNFGCFVLSWRGKNWRSVVSPKIGLHEEVGHLI
jgi:hypothetical protein